MSLCLTMPCASSLAGSRYRVVSPLAQAVHPSMAACGETTEEPALAFSNDECFDLALPIAVLWEQKVGPAMLQTPRAVAPPEETGDANRLYYSQTRSRQEAGLFRLRECERRQSWRESPRGRRKRIGRPSTPAYRTRARTGRTRPPSPSRQATWKPTARTKG